MEISNRYRDKLVENYYGEDEYCILDSASIPEIAEISGDGLVLGSNLGFGRIEDPCYALGTIALSSGKWYWEISNDPIYDGFVGVAKAGASFGYAGDDSLSWVHRNNAWSYNGKAYHNGVDFPYGDSDYHTGVGIYLDMDNGKIYFVRVAGYTGTYIYPGSDPAYTYNNVTGPVYPVCGFYPYSYYYRNSSYSQTLTMNFGQNAFIGSGTALPNYTQGIYNPAEQVTRNIRTKLTATGASAGSPIPANRYRNSLKAT
jgi:hypothetical protein